MKMDEILQQSPIIPVLMLEEVELAVPLAQALRDGGIRILEVTLRTPAALEIISKIRQHVDDLIVGAGTVIRPHQVQQAQQQGAQFLVSPGLTSDLAQAAKASHLPFLPGVATVSEVLAAYEQGFERLKFFPATCLGGTATLRAFAPLFPKVKFCPTGGITQESLLDYYSLPNVQSVGGTWLTSPELIAAGDWSAVTQLAQQTLALINQHNN